MEVLDPLGVLVCVGILNPGSLDWSHLLESPVPGESPAGLLLGTVRVGRAGAEELAPVPGPLL